MRVNDGTLVLSRQERSGFEEAAQLCKSVEELAVGEVKSQAAIAAAAIVTLIAAMPVEPEYGVNQ